MLLLIPCIPVIAAASALKGYFYGIQDVVPTACSQVVEQLVKTFLVMAMAGYFVNVGLEYVLVVVYKFKKKRACANASKKGFMRKRVIVKEIVKISIPVSFNFITSIMSTVEFILIPRMLVKQHTGIWQTYGNGFRPL